MAGPNGPNLNPVSGQVFTYNGPSAAESWEDAPVSPAIANGTSPDAGTLTGAEIVPMSRGTGLLQTTLTKIAAFVLTLFTIVIAAGPGAALRTILAKLRGLPVQPEDYGAVGDGVTDDSAAFALISNLSIAIDGAGKTYAVNAISLNSISKISNITFVPSSAFTGQVLVTIGASNVDVDVLVDAKGGGFTCVELTGNYASGVIEGRNVIGVPQAQGGTQAACKLSGQYADVLVKAQNFAKGTADNDSVPRACTVDISGAGTGNNNTVSILAFNMNAGLVVSQPQCYVRSLIIDGTTDNGIYHLQGNLDADVVTLKNSVDEPVVTEGTCRIGRLSVINGEGTSGIQNGFLTIGEFFIASSDPTLSTVPLRSRPGNTYGTVKIGALRGELWLTDVSNGAGIFQFGTGTVDVDVDVVDLKVHYRAGSTTQLMNHAAGNKVRFGRIGIELIDDTGSLTNATKFYFQIAAGLTQPSYVGHVDMVSSTGELRVSGMLQNGMQIAPYMEISTTYGPYILQQNQSTPCPRFFVASAIPTIGVWLRGDVLQIKSPFISGTCEYVCTTGGDYSATPPVWRASKWLTGKGLTASRPALLPIDVGVNYMDTTLNANGKPIKWNGTSWVDSTGAIV